MVPAQDPVTGQQVGGPGNAGVQEELLGQLMSKANQLAWVSSVLGACCILWHSLRSDGY